MQDAIWEIESHEFASRLNVASNMETFLRIAEEQDVVRAVFQGLDSPAEQGRLFQRTLELSRSSTDLRYENQWDVALAIYLWLVNLKNPNLAMLMAGIIASVPQCWWATKMSYSILKQSPLHNDAGFVDSKLAVYQAVVSDITEGRYSGETILSPRYLGGVDRVLDWHPKKTGSQGITSPVQIFWSNMPYVYAGTGDKSGFAVEG